MRSAEEQRAIREDVFRWLDIKLETGAYELTRTELENYAFGDERIPLLDQNRGIRNPADFDSTLSIMTSANGPYDDFADDDGYVRYHYRAQEGGDNRKLRAAFVNGDPMIYFERVRAGAYVAHYPAYIVGDDPGTRTVTVALDQAMRFFGDPLHMTVDQRRYAEQVVRRRLHQPMFRARVMTAYVSTCAVCNLKHPDLLDAAHIISDAALHGVPQVTNGLALCKIHHAAYDRNLMGITPDYVVQINAQLLDEVDGPMLRHGLQDMHGRELTVPRRIKDQPSRDSLAERFAEFAA